MSHAGYFHLWPAGTGDPYATATTDGELLTQFKAVWDARDLEKRNKVSRLVSQHVRPQWCAFPAAWTHYAQTPPEEIVKRTFAHLLSGTSAVNGGRAYIGVLCGSYKFKQHNSYGVCGNIGSGFKWQEDQASDEQGCQA